MTHSTDLPCPISQCLARWSTAAYPDAAETSSFDLWSLSSHVQHCSGQVSHTERLHRAAGWAGGMVRVRLMTFVVVAVLVLGAGFALAA